MSGKKIPWQPIGVILSAAQLLLGIAHLSGRHQQREALCVWCRLQ